MPEGLTIKVEGGDEQEIKITHGEDENDGSEFPSEK